MIDAPTQEQLDKFQWYHHYAFPNGAQTRPTVDCQDVWDHIKTHLIKREYLSGRHVLDAGCRDCFWSLQAEDFGAASVTGVDISLNPGVAELILPYYRSNIEQRQLNVMKAASLGRKFDTILCLGLLYHLRYPFSALKLFTDMLTPEGFLLIETAILDKPEVADMPMLWCPVKTSPYERTSCTFFNSRGMRETMDALGMTLVAEVPMKRQKHNHPGMDRGAFVFMKSAERDPFLEVYWNDEASTPELEKLDAQWQWRKTDK